MTIRIARSRLLDGLKKVQSAANAKSAVQIYSNVKVVAKDGKMSLTTTDGDITLHSVIDAEVTEAGEITVPMKTMLNAVEKMVDGETTMKVDGEKILLSQGKFKVTMTGISAEQFPKLPAPQTCREFTVKAKSLVEMIRRVAYAQSPDETRISLKSVLMVLQNGNMSCVATDGRRLGIAEGVDCEEITTGANEPVRLIVPSRTVSVCQRFLDVDGDITIKSYGSQVMFSIGEGDGYLFTRLVDAEYPNYVQVIPKYEMKVALVDRNLLVSSLDRMTILDSAGEISVKMTFADGFLRMEIKSDCTSSDAIDEIPIKYNGDKVEILFNPKYVLEPLRAADSDEIEFKIADGAKPAVINDDGSKFFCVLMPMRIH